MKELKLSHYIAMENNSAGDLLIRQMRTGNYVKIKKSDIANFYKVIEEAKNSNWEESKFKKQIWELSEMSFLINNSLDESLLVDATLNYQVYSNEWLYVTIIPTDYCNFRCIYCYESNIYGFMNNDTEEKILKFFEKNVEKYRHVRLTWFGGEPLVEKERLLRMTKKISDICKEKGVPLVGIISTNGYELDIQTFNELVKNRILAYQICLDGDETTHNIQRPHEKLNDSYQRIMSNLQAIKNGVKTSTFKITVRANLTPLSESRLNEHLDNLYSILGDDKRFRVYFQGVRDWGGDRIKKNHVEIIEDEQKYYKKWYDVALDKGLNSAEYFPLTPVFGLCEANFRNGFVINYDGKLHKCSLAMHDAQYMDETCIGYIDENGNAQIDEIKQTMWYIKKEQKERCRKCYMYPLCVGGQSCPFSSNIKNISSGCLPLKEVIKAHLRCLDKKAKICTLGFNDGEKTNE